MTKITVPYLDAPGYASTNTQHTAQPFHRMAQNELKLKFEAVKQMDEEEQRLVTAVLDALILKHQAKRLIG